jgi:hypothetical protein
MARHCQVLWKRHVLPVAAMGVSSTTEVAAAVESGQLQLPQQPQQPQQQQQTANPSLALQQHSPLIPCMFATASSACAGGATPRSSLWHAKCGGVCVCV